MWLRKPLYMYVALATTQRLTSVARKRMNHPVFPSKTSPTESTARKINPMTNVHVSGIKSAKIDS